MVAELAKRLRSNSQTDPHRERYYQFQKTYYHDPAGFARDCFVFPPGEDFADYQYDILDKLIEYRRVAVRGPHGLGKTSLAAIVVLWAILTSDDVKVVTTASAWRQLREYLWPEIHKWARRIAWGKVGRPPLTQNELLFMELKLSPMQKGFAVASNDHNKIEGAHAKRMVYVFDESKTIPDETFDAAEGAFSGTGTGDEAYALAISTPGPPLGRFYDIHRRKRGLENWYAYHVTIQQAIAAGRIGQQWVDQSRALWGEDSPTFQTRVLGEFAADDPKAVIPLSWINAAIERWHEWVAAGRPGTLTAVGVDVGLTGDRTVIAPRFGDAIDTLQYPDPETPATATMATAGRVANLLQRHNIKAKAIVDVIGIGAGVCHRLSEQGFKAVAFNAGSGTEVTDRSGAVRFVNKRSAAWWGMRERLDPTYNPVVCLPDDPILIGDLTAPKFDHTSSGRIRVNSKDDIKQEIGRSTDAADAVIQAFWEEKAGVYFG